VAPLLHKGIDGIIAKRRGCDNVTGWFSRKLIRGTRWGNGQATLQKATKCFFHLLLLPFLDRFTIIKDLRQLNKFLTGLCDYQNINIAIFLL
jgi:hypothetical protein